MKISDLLPIGSIVLLRDGEKRLMIIGVMQNDAGGTGNNYDYLGILYPEGHIGEGFQYLFNHEDIVEIIFHIDTLRYYSSALGYVILYALALK